MNLTTLERAKLVIFGGQKDEETTKKYDSLIRTLIVGESQRIELSHIFDRYIQKKERTEQFDTEYEQRVVSLKGYPIDSSATLKVWWDDSLGFSDLTLLTINSDFIPNYNRGLLYFDDYRLVEGRQALKVQWTGGFASSVDRLTGTYTGLSGTFTAGEEVEGQTSKARGRVVAIAGGNLSVDVMYGVFELGESVKGQSSSATCSIATMTSIPLIMSYPDLAMACDLQVAFAYQRKNDLGLQSISIEGGSVSKYQNLDFLPEVKKIIGAYRRMGDVS